MIKMLMKSLMSKMLNLQNDYLITRQLSDQGISVPASGYTQRTISGVSVAGYTPIGMVKLTKDGGSSLYCLMSNWSISGDNFSYSLRNTSTSAATVNIYPTILYVKNP